MRSEIRLVGAAVLNACVCMTAAADDKRPTLLASRLVGTAPLAVFFDATPLAADTVGAFTSSQFVFDFGDERGLVWSVSGQSKNQEKGGPLAAHVYDLPGRYLVTARITDANGQVRQSTVTIQVEGPDVAYAGRQTVCVSRERAYAACPAGAEQRTSLPSSFSGKRVLLRAGESFGAITVPYDHESVQIGAYGEGAPPSVDRVDIGSGRPPHKAQFPVDITVAGLFIREALTQWASARRILIYRNDFALNTERTAQISIGNALPWWAEGKGDARLPSSSYVWPSEIFVVENVVHSTRSGAVTNFFSSGSAKMALLGNDMAEAKQHSARIGGLHQGVISHNALRGGSLDGARHSLKLHGLGMTAFHENFDKTGNAWATGKVVISHNTFGSATDNNAITVAVAPQNGVRAEGVEDVVVEDNVFVRGTSTQYDLVLGGRRLLHRRNAVSGTTSFKVQTDAHASALPANWRGPYLTR